jgi:P-type Mg2+ transporter
VSRVWPGKSIPPHGHFKGNGTRADRRSRMNPVTSSAPAPPAFEGQGIAAFWSLPPEKVLRMLRSGKQGLTSGEARRRLALPGAGLIRPQSRHGRLALLAGQFKSPIILILIAAAGLSASLGQRTDALIILAIVLGSGLLGFWQECGAADAVEALLARVRIKAAVIRDGEEVEVPAEEVVPGDLVVLNAGDIIPADCLVLEAKDLHLDEVPVHRCSPTVAGHV